MQGRIQVMETIRANLKEEKGKASGPSKSSMLRISGRLGLSKPKGSGKRKTKKRAGTGGPEDSSPRPGEQDIPAGMRPRKPRANSEPRVPESGGLSSPLEDAQRNKSMDWVGSGKGEDAEPTLHAS